MTRTVAGIERDDILPTEMTITTNVTAEIPATVGERSTEDMTAQKVTDMAVDDIVRRRNATEADRVTTNTAVTTTVVVDDGRGYPRGPTDIGILIALV